MLKRPKKKRRKEHSLMIILIETAVFSIIFSIFLNSIFLTFIGLGLVIWTTILFLSTTQKVVKINIVTPQMVELMIAFDSLLSRLGYEKKAILNPPKIAGENSSLQIFKTGQIEQHTMNPIGLNLAFLIERKSPSDLFSTEFGTFSEFLSKVFTDEFEFASGFKMELENDLVHIQITDFLFKEMCVQVENSSQSICRRHLCPICSAIACLIAKVTHKSVSLDRILFNQSNTIEIYFKTSKPKFA